MRTADITAALCRGMFPPDKYLTIEEAPTNASRQGQRCDLVAIGYWSSRGYGIDAVEVKSAWPDLKKELDNYAKADWWYMHSDRFWLATTEQLAAKVLHYETLPETWGLIAVHENGKCYARVRAPKHDRKPLSWTATVGIMRCASGAGTNALQRAHAVGREEGRKIGERLAASGTVQAQLDDLMEKVERAEKATGVPISAWGTSPKWLGRYHSVEEIQLAVRAVLDMRHATQAAQRALGQSERSLAQALEAVQKALASMTES